MKPTFSIIKQITALAGILLLMKGGLMANDSILTDFIRQIRWTGQASIIVHHHRKTVYFDPWSLDEYRPADIIFISHTHGDHFSPKDITKIITPDTRIIAPENCQKELGQLHHSQIIFVNPGQTIDIDSLKIKVVPAYNQIKTKFHPKSNKWCGYVVDFGELVLYHSGDTERIPEMKTIHCNIAFLPLGQTYTMESVESAATAALDIQPQVLIPMHFGLYEGSESDTLKLKQLLEGKIKVTILERHNR